MNAISVILSKSVITLLIIFNPFAYLGLSVDLGASDIEIASMYWENTLTSSLRSLNPNFFPIRNWQIPETEIEAKAGMIALLRINQQEDGDPIFSSNINQSKILYSKNQKDILPIASLTKLMTALIVFEGLELNDIATISKEAINTSGTSGDLQVNEQINIEKLLYVMLLESSNDAAVALSQHYEEVNDRTFNELMNSKSQEIGLYDTVFYEPTGLDSRNVSTVEDIVKLVEYSLRYPFLWKILNTSKINIISESNIPHYWENTDILLNKMPGVLGGKTGYTDAAQGCLTIAIEKQSTGNTRELIISVVLGAQRRFLETEKLIRWIDQAYKWE